MTDKFAKISTLKLKRGYHVQVKCNFQIIEFQIQIRIIPTQCFYRFFGDFDWSVGKIKLFLHFDKSPCVGIYDNCLDITVVDCVNNNELYIKL